MRKSLLLITCMVVLAVPAFAQSTMELTPTIGYVFGGSFDDFASNSLSGVSANVDNSESYGLIFDAGTPLNAVEITWMHQSTDLTTNSSSVGPFKYKSDNLQIGGVHYFSDGQTRPFVNISFGGANIDIGETSLHNRFTFGLGGGVSHYFNDRLGVRGQARWIPTYVNTTDAHVACDPFGFCYTMGNDNFIYQTEVSVGLIIKIR